MLTPILLNESNEELMIEYGDNKDQVISLISYIGLHVHGRGTSNELTYFVYLDPISRTHNVLRCAVCGRMTEPIPKEVNTYRKLEEHRKDRMERNKRMFHKIEHAGEPPTYTPATIFED